MKSLFLLIFPLLVIGCGSKPNQSSEESLETKAYNAAELGNYKVSLNYYNQLIKKDSLNGAYYFGRGDSYMMLLKKEDAIKDYLKSSQLNYRKGSCYFNLGLLYSFVNDSIALIYFNRALKMNLKGIDVQTQYDECLKRLKTKATY